MFLPCKNTVKHNIQKVKTIKNLKRKNVKLRCTYRSRTLLIFEKVRPLRPDVEETLPELERKKQETTPPVKIGEKRRNRCVKRD